MTTRKLLAACVLLLLVGCGHKRIDVDARGKIKLRGEKPVNMKRKKAGDLLQKGIASWYGRPYHGRKTSNGERYDMDKLTAAHKTIPFNTWVRVVNQETGEQVVVRINDRGPFVRDRVIDLSREAARRLGIYGKGTTRVKLYLAGEPGKKRKKKHKSIRPKPEQTPTIQTPRKPEPEQEAGVTYAPDEIIEQEILEPPLGEGAPPPRATDGESYHTIQVGSFSSRERAQAMAQQMSRYSRDVSVQETAGVWRVRVGRFLHKQDAQDLAEILQANDIPTWITTGTQ